MALIPSDKKQQKALVGIIAAAGALYAFYTYWYGPQVEEVSGMESRVETLETRNRQAQVQAARGGTDLEERNALYERHVAELEELIPRGEEVPQLIRTINQQARATQVMVATMNPEPDQPGEFYTKQGWSLQVIGEYDNVGRFITSVASLQRIITPVDVDVATYTPPVGMGMDYLAPVVVTFRIETYILPDPGAAPPPAEVGAGG